MLLPIWSACTGIFPQCSIVPHTKLTCTISVTHLYASSLSFDKCMLTTKPTLHGLGPAPTLAPTTCSRHVGHPCQQTYMSQPPKMMCLPLVTAIAPTTPCRHVGRCRQQMYVSRPPEMMCLPTVPPPEMMLHLPTMPPTYPQVNRNHNLPANTPAPTTSNHNCNCNHSGNCWNVPRTAGYNWVSKDRYSHLLLDG